MRIPQITSLRSDLINPIEGLRPVVDASTSVLILGTFPAAESIQSKLYYKNQNTRFWGQALSTIGNFLNLIDRERHLALLEYNIGLWDIFMAVERADTNQDSGIKRAVCNDVLGLTEKYPQIKYIIFNGKNALNWLKDEQPKVFNSEKIATKRLQSSSGSNGWFRKGEDWDNYFRKIGLANNRS